MDRSDLRRHTRFELFEYAFIHVEGDPQSKRSVLVDVSIGGAQVRTRDQIEVGSTASLQITDGSGEPISVSSEVRYSYAIDGTDLYAIGFRFSPANPEEKAKIVRYVHDFFKAQGELLLDEDSA